VLVLFVLVLFVLVLFDVQFHKFSQKLNKSFFNSEQFYIKKH